MHTCVTTHLYNYTHFCINHFLQLYYEETNQICGLRSSEKKRKMFSDFKTFWCLFCRVWGPNNGRKWQKGGKKNKNKIV